MRTGRTFNNLIAVIVLIAATLLALISGVGVTYAATTRYSDVLDDLRKDSAFNVADYPAVNDDYSLKVIQIAESTDGELFLYVYQPAAKSKFLKATQVNMSLTNKMGGEVNEGEELTPEDKPKLYNLTFLNNAGVFQKYRVDGITVSSEAIRYYNITSIYRDWIKDVDDETGNDNPTNAVYFEVAKLLKAETVDGNVNYSCTVPDVVEIIEPYVDFISYYNAPQWIDLIFMTEKSTDIHYIAFSTDKQINTLREADVTYRTRSYTSGRGTTYGDLSVPKYLTLTGKEEFNVTSTSKYTWQSIMRSADFINKTDDLNEDTKKIISKSEFVLVFLSTPYSERSASDMAGHYTKKTGTKVSNVSILRLEFETEGTVYNLGALMNQQEGDDIPGNQKKPIGFWAYIWRCIVRLFTGTATLSEQIVAVIVILIVLVILPVVVLILSIVFPAFGAIVKTVFKVIWTGLIWLLKGLWWLICSPFRGIAALIRKRRKAAPVKVAPSKSCKTKAPKRSKSSRRSTSRSKSTRTRSKRK